MDAMAQGTVLGLRFGELTIAFFVGLEVVLVVSVDRLALRHVLLSRVAGALATGYHGVGRFEVALSLLSCLPRPGKMHTFFWEWMAGDIPAPVKRARHGLDEVRVHLLELFLRPFAVL